MSAPARARRGGRDADDEDDMTKPNGTVCGRRAVVGASPTTKCMHAGALTTKCMHAGALTTKCMNAGALTTKCMHAGALTTKCMHAGAPWFELSPGARGYLLESWASGLHR